MAWKHIGAVALLALSAGAALMQDATETALVVPFPEVVVYEPETGALYNVTADGIRAGANMSDVPGFAGQTGYNYMLSPDRTRLFFSVAEMAADNMGVATLYSADVASGACCEAFDPQNPVMNNILNAAFSPDGTQIVVSYFSNQYEPITPGQLVIYDIVTREIAARLDGSRLDLTKFSGNVQPGILFTQWTNAGIVVIPSCTGCESALAGVGQLWNPADDSLSAAIVPYNFQDQVIATGETLRASFDPSFPNNPDAMGMLPVPNVVTYTPPQVGSIDAPPAIYFNPNNMYINRVEWIADGQAILIQHADQGEWFSQSDEAYVLLRDGTQIPLTVPLTRTFLGATSDGWVMTDNQTRAFVYYRLTGTTVEEIVLDATYSENSYPVLVEHPILGASMTNQLMFPAVTAP